MRIMQAVVYRKYGSADVLQVDTVNRPIPRNREVLVKVHAASVNAADWRMMRADPFLTRLHSGLFRPTRCPILGGDIAGVVVDVGRKVTQFKRGDEVFGDVSGSGFGGFAEFKCARESELALKPANLTFEQAAATPMAALAALHGLRDKGHIWPGQKVLINGASGGVGTFAIQLAKHFKAEVTAVCSTRKMEIARKLGADHVIDYTREDFTQSGKEYDLILAINGYHPIADYRRALSPKGVYAMVGGDSSQLFQALLLGPLISLTGRKKMGFVSPKHSQKDMNFLKGILESGKIIPLIEKRFPLVKAADAIRYVEQGHAAAKVVIVVAHT